MTNVTPFENESRPVHDRMISGEVWVVDGSDGASLMARPTATLAVH